MRGIVYVSEALTYFDNMSLESLAAQAAAYNFEKGISGYLYFEKDRFVQYVEGDEDAVDELIATIKRDERHRIVYLVVEDNLEERRFPSWHMRQLSRQELAEVKLEHLLTDYLVHLEQGAEPKAEASSRRENIVWGMVNRLSTVRGKLSYY